MRDWLMALLGFANGLLVAAVIHLFLSARWKVQRAQLSALIAQMQENMRKLGPTAEDADKKRRDARKFRTWVDVEREAAEREELERRKLSET